MNPFHQRLGEVLRWARANDWRPRYPGTRRLGQYTWTNAVTDPGIRRQSTLRVTVDISGTVEVRQLMTTSARTTGWVTIGQFRSGSGYGILDVLAGMSVLPVELSPSYTRALESTRREIQWGVRTTYTDGSVGTDWTSEDEARSFLSYYADHDGLPGMHIADRELVCRPISVFGDVEHVSCGYRQARDSADQRAGRGRTPDRP